MPAAFRLSSERVLPRLYSLSAISTPNRTELLISIPTPTWLASQEYFAHQANQQNGLSTLEIGDFIPPSNAPKTAWGFGFSLLTHTITPSSDVRIGYPIPTLDLDKEGAVTPLGWHTARSSIASLMALFECLDTADLNHPSKEEAYQECQVLPFVHKDEHRFPCGLHACLSSQYCQILKDQETNWGRIARDVEIAMNNTNAILFGRPIVLPLSRVEFRQPFVVTFNEPARGSLRMKQKMEPGGIDLVDDHVENPIQAITLLVGFATLAHNLANPL
ncbi:MAG: hypothetical protein K8Q97_04685 [Candidatus Andersenbacteria bacterium]|nr:hypothetical protein [Candidatus Andersenbacteria bacterium]